MSLYAYPIRFDYWVEDIPVSLFAEIYVEGKTSLIARNFKAARSGLSCCLPEIELVKVDDHWVHSESRKESSLSHAIGRAIENRLRPTG